MKNRILRNIDWGILICSICLLAIGMIALFSATNNDGGDELSKQILWACASIPVLIIFVAVDYKLIAKASPVFYVIFIGLLIAVLFTRAVNGATSWFEINSTLKFQPGEFAKVFVIITLAEVIAILQKKGKREINKPHKLLVALLVVAIPVALIIKQPDLGTAMAFLVATIFVLFVAGINKKYIFAAILICAITAPILYTHLPDHAKTRIDVFLNPEIDPRGSGYNVIQSKLAIGSGEFWGMGILKGNQTQLGYLYPKTTDFIFSVIGEEMGFVVAGAVIIIYVFLITKSIYVAKTAKDDLGSYIAIGICGIFFFHMVENIGMTMGLLPITGVPLPFVSYGGSSLITNFICIGLLLNISGRRKKAIFVE